MNTDENGNCAILYNTTFQKSGICIEGVSKVFDHVTYSFIYGMKCLTLALWREKLLPHRLIPSLGKKDYDLTIKQRNEQFKKKRNAKNPDYARKTEYDERKLEMIWRMRLLTIGLHMVLIHAVCIMWQYGTLNRFCQNEPQITLSNKSKYPLNVHELIARYELTLFYIV